MRNRLFLLLTAFALIGISQQAIAQGVLTPTVQAGFLIGPVGGINLVAYNNSDAFPILNEEKSCFQAQNGSGVAPWGGISIEFPLGNANELQSFIVGDVIYNSQSASFTAKEGSVAATPTKLNGVSYDQSSVATSLSAQLSYLTINLAYKYNFTPGPSPIGPGIQVGPSIGIKTGAQFTKTVTVTAVNPASTQDNTNPLVSTVSPTFSDSSAAALRIALRAQFTYDIAFSPDWIVTPTVGYDFPITNADNNINNSGSNWRTSAIFAGIYFRYFIHG